MKRKLTLIPCLLLMLMCACGDKEEEYNDGITRYTVVGNVPSVASDMIAKATIYEYNSADVRIDSNTINDPSSGKRYVFEANTMTNHLKVRLDSKQETYRWGDTIVMIHPGKNVTITISITSPTTKFEPSLFN